MRITLDLDNMKEKIIRGKAILLKIAFPECRVRHRISSSGNGGHVEVFGADVDEYLMYNIRMLFGDHIKRVMIDASRGKDGRFMLPQQVLFDFKIKDGKILRAGEWKEITRTDVYV